MFFVLGLTEADGADVADVAGGVVVAGELVDALIVELGWAVVGALSADPTPHPAQTTNDTRKTPSVPRWRVSTGDSPSSVWCDVYRWAQPARHRAGASVRH